MTNKEEAKTKIALLVKEFERDPRKDKLTEEETKEYIKALFEALGWNTRTDMRMEEQISRKFVDYGFRINDLPVMYLEAKKTSVSIQEPQFVEQAIDYAWHKATTWAVLTNFKELRIFNAYVKESTQAAQLRYLYMSEFLTEFDSLWLLSKESFETKLIDKVAEKEGKKAREKSVVKQLFDDLNKWRENLAKEIKKEYSAKYSTEEIDEMIQLLLDRLILIRRIEDENLESRRLEELLNVWADGGKVSLWKSLQKLFREFDEIYNSKIFSVHELDKIEISNETLKLILPELYHSRDKTVRYNFALIDADILGNIYEQYLGYLLKTTAKRAAGAESKATRKEQGIYYTPRYVVDYIVKNTIGEKLKSCKKLKDVEEIKVLDSACGSGSFLIRAFDEIYSFYEQKDWANKAFLTTDDHKSFETVKDRILKNNIYGVDLDSKAVEIAQLNLLLKTTDKKHKLPTLQDNIKTGNSLINDPKNTRHPFDWNIEFKEIMKNGGFDVIIGNPPYVDIKQLEPSTVKYLFENYETVENRMNLYSTFIEKAFRLLKDEGYFGFIIPNSFLYNESYAKLRSLLLKESSFKKIIRLPDDVFEGVKVETVIIIFQKKINARNICDVVIFPQNTSIKTIKPDSNNIIQFSQQKWKENNTINITSNSSITDLLVKMEKKGKPLSEVCDFSLGLTPYDKYKGHTQKQIEERAFHSNEKKDENYKPLLSGENIVRFGVLWDGKEYIKYGKWLGASREQRFFQGPRIIVRQIISGNPPRIYAGYTEEELYNTQIAFTIIPKNGNISETKYLTGILNSNLINFFHREKFLDPTKRLFQKILIANAKRLPIVDTDNKTKSKLIDVVEDLNKLTSELQRLKNKITKRKDDLLTEINRKESEMNQIVYKIYGLEKDEIELIEKVSLLS